MYSEKEQNEDKEKWSPGVDSLGVLSVHASHLILGQGPSWAKFWRKKRPRHWAWHLPSSWLMRGQLPKSKSVKKIAPGELNFDPQKMGVRQTEKLSPRCQNWCKFLLPMLFTSLILLAMLSSPGRCQPLAVSKTLCWGLAGSKEAVGPQFLSSWHLLYDC